MSRMSDLEHELYLAAEAKAVEDGNALALPAPQVETVTTYPFPTAGPIVKTSQGSYRVTQAVVTEYPGEPPYVQLRGRKVKGDGTDVARGVETALYDHAAEVMFLAAHESRQAPVAVPDEGRTQALALTSDMGATTTS